MDARFSARRTVVASGVCLAALVGHVVADDSSATSRPAPDRSPFIWSQLPPVPDERGFAGAYTGISHGALIIAGGANFPDGPPWSGGIKHWYSGAFVLPPDGKTWTRVDAALPSLRGYGASLTTPFDGVLCIGGADATKHYSDVFTLDWDGKQIIKHDLPSLPLPLANIAAAAVGATVYVAGGIELPTSTAASNRFFVINFMEPKPTWRELETWPGPPRMLAVATTVDGAFYLMSGVSLSGDAAGKPVRTYLKDAYRYTPGAGWKQLADLPHPTAAAPSPAAALPGHGFVIFGGDDGANVNFEPKDKHPGFNHDVLAFDAKTNTWSVVGQLPLGQVTIALVPYRGGFVIPNGEIRPAVRTPIVSLAMPAPTTELATEPAK